MFYQSFYWNQVKVSKIIILKLLVENGVYIYTRSYSGDKWCIYIL